MENPFATERFSPLPEHAVSEIYRNKRLDLPFEPKDTALFLDREQGTVELRVQDYHHRSADLGVNTVVRERGKNAQHVYCQFDLKGLGFLFPESHESKLYGTRVGDLAGYPEAHAFLGSRETPWGYDTLGLMDERMAIIAAKQSELLTARGMRTEAFVSVMRLEQIMIGGASKSVADFKREAVVGFKQGLTEEQDKEKIREKREMIRDFEKMFQPVIALRLMRSVFRLRDLKDANEREAPFILEEACASLNHEAQALGLQERYACHTREDRERWLESIAEMFGKNLGILHGAGLVHQYLHMGNLSLAGEIIDLDSVQKLVLTVPFRGKSENKDAWLEKTRMENSASFFQETEKGCAFVNPEIGGFVKPDPRFELPKALTKDFRDLCFSLRMIGKNMSVTVEARQMMAEKLIAGYVEGLGAGDPWQVIGVGKERLLEVVYEIADEVVAKGQSMPRILDDEET